MNLDDGIIWYLVFLFSIVIHEASHAFTSYKLGDLTAYNSGQVSLNPIPHLKREPIGTIVVPIISLLLAGWMLGWASTPFDKKWAIANPKKAGMMAAAGPLSNLLLLLFTVILIKLGIGLGYFYSHPYQINPSSLVSATEHGFVETVATILSIMFSLNLILFIFNVLPIPPLDGSSIPLIFLDSEKGKRYMEAIKNPAFTFIGIFLMWKVFGLVAFQIFLLAANMLYPGGHYR